MSSKQCEAITQKGTRCKNYCGEYDRKCLIHRPKCCSLTKKGKRCKKYSCYGQMYCSSHLEIFLSKRKMKNLMFYSKTFKSFECISKTESDNVKNSLYNHLNTILPTTYFFKEHHFIPRLARRNFFIVDERTAFFNTNDNIFLFESTPNSGCTMIKIYHKQNFKPPSLKDESIDLEIKVELDFGLDNISMYGVSSFNIVKKGVHYTTIVIPLGYVKSGGKIEVYRHKPVPDHFEIAGNEIRQRLNKGSSPIYITYTIPDGKEFKPNSEIEFMYSKKYYLVLGEYTWNYYQCIRDEVSESIYSKYEAMCWYNRYVRGKYSKFIFSRIIFEKFKRTIGV